MKTVLISAAVLAVSVSGAANASILHLTAFGGFVQGSQFVPDPDPSVGGGQVPEGFPTLTYYGCQDDPICTSISWGNPFPPGNTAGPFNGQSGASINYTIPGSERDTPAENAIEISPNTLGQAFVLGTLTHFNEPVTGDPNPDTDGFIGGIGVDYKIEIEKFDDDTGDSLGTWDITLPFDLVFFETENEDPCDQTPNPVGTTCDDTFQYFGDEIIGFKIAGQKYTLEVIGFCSNGNANGNFNGFLCEEPGIFYSGEDGSSVGYVLEIKEAPTPGVIALMSAGLLGLGLARRRRANRA